ncbi:MAG: prolyl oligopeptidase family serine peptidase [Odoribacter sp.]|nr:prolyl oligopeptidase family serine peptidase [Odoribacter sp.]
MYKFFSLLILSCMLVPVMAQQYKANWAQIKKFENIVKEFRNDVSVYPRFINETDVFWYRLRTSEGVNYYLVDPSKKLHTELFNMKSMLAQMAELTRKAYTSTVLEYVNMKFSKDGKSFTFSHDGTNFNYDLRTRKLSKIEKKDENKDEYIAPSGHMISPDSSYYIYAYKHNLYCYGNKAKGMDTTIVQLTTDGERAYSYSKYPSENPEEESYPAGRWLKHTNTFLVEMSDERKTDKMYIVDMLNQPRPKLVDYQYSCPGDEHIGQYFFKLIDVKTQDVKEIWAEKWKDQYVDFAYDNTGHGSEFFFYRTRRSWDEKDLCAYNVKTGDIRVVYNEVDKPYFDYVIAQTHFLNDADEILFRSERTGLGHFYLYDGKTGKMKRAVTEGDFLTGQVIKVDTARREVYLYAYGREEGVDPYYYMAYRVSLDKPGMELLTPGNANHKVFVSPSSKYIIDTYSRVDMPFKAVVRNRNGKEIMKLKDPDLKPLLAQGWRFPERFTVKAADGITDLYGVMWKPMDFDSTRKYPIISEVYPGPQFEYVPTSFELESSKATRLAQLGFIVIQVGHRGGTPLRGKAYHRYGYGKLRDYPLADDQAAIKELARRYPFIDVTKAGMFGHSGGGFMSAAAICSSNFYKAAVATAGNHDNRIYNTGWIEMNNGVREKIVKNEKNPADSIRFEALPIHTNIDIAKNCRGHLLLVTGMMDDNVHPAHTFRMARALMDAGINFDMLALPESTHGLVGSEDDYFLFKMRNHFAKYLLGDFSGEEFMNFQRSGY